MPYEKQTWVNGDATRPLSASRLNHMEDGIAAAGGGTPINVILVPDAQWPPPADNDPKNFYVRVL